MDLDRERAGELFQDAVELVRRQRLRPALACLLEVLRHEPRHREALASAARLTRLLGDGALADRFDDLSRAPDEANAHYEIGYAMIDAGRPDLAAVFLHECTRLAPESDLVHHELGYALHRARRFQQAESWLRSAWSSENLAPSEAIESGLLLVECLVCLRKLDEAARLLDQIAADPSLETEQRQRTDGLAGLLGRARTLEGARTLDLRDWHFIQHGGAILRMVGSQETRGAAGGRCLEAQPGYAFTAAVLRLAAGLLEDLDQVPSRVLAASDASVPLAAVLARVLDRPAGAFTGSEEGLIVVRTPAELGPRLADLAVHDDRCALFTFCLEWPSDLPVLPEIVGIMARHLVLPWEPSPEVRDAEGGQLTVAPGGDKPPDLLAATGDLLAAAERLDVTAERQALRSYYRRRRDALVLGNPDVFPRRPVFTAHSPVETSEVIFP